jgi:ubiquinone/menaquinone biosynthesis C-methylase UbiE
VTGREVEAPSSEPWINRTAQAFGSAAEEYEQGRPGYPEEAVRWLIRRLRIGAGTTTVDLAAGTGKLTRLLVQSGTRAIAVEPVASMREILQRLVPTAEARVGTAESIPLADSSAEAVTVAQAFHWFRSEEALNEISRVLTAAGSLGLVWNRRDLADPVQTAIDEIVQPHRGGAPAYPAGSWRTVFDHTSLFTPLEEQRFRFEQVVDRTGLVDRVASISFIAALPEAPRARVLEEVRAVAAGLPEQIALPHITEVFTCTRR